jgi:hypothetical protein
MIRRIALTLPLLFVPLMAHAARPEHTRPSTVTVWNASFERETSFDAFEKEYLNGGTLAVGDVDADGSMEIVVGAGPERLPDIRIFSMSGELKKIFRAYPEWFKGGVRVAVGDLDGDGKAEIATAPGPGIEPQINVFRSDGTQAIPGGVWAYPKGFLAGVHVAVGDLDGDGKAEIVTAPGPGGGPHVRVWSGTMQPIRDFFAYDAGMTDGVTLTILNSKWGPAIVTGVESWSAPLVRRFSTDGNLLKEFYAFATSSHSGVSVTAWDMDGDGTDEVITTPNGGVATEAAIFDLYGTEYRRHAFMDASYRGGVSLAVAPRGIVSMPAAPTVSERTDVPKGIRVDLIEQRLYAFEHGRVAKTMPVSSGLLIYPTPEMETTIKEKIPVKRYRWFYGPDNPHNYDVPNVKWNMNIFGPFYIHHAYWHNGFGRRRSHGCINVGKEAEWLYNWAEVGIPVSVMNGAPQEKAAGLRVAGKR